MQSKKINSKKQSIRNARKAKQNAQNAIWQLWSKVNLNK